MGLNPPTPAMLSPVEEDLRRSISPLILSVIAVEKIYYWSFQGRGPAIVLVDLDRAPSSALSINFCQGFIQAQHQQLAENKILIANQRQQCREFPVKSGDYDQNQYDWLFLAAGGPGQIQRGIGLGYCGDWQRSSHGPFLQAIAKNYNFYGQLLQCHQDNLPSEKKPQANQETALNLSHIHHEFRTPLTGILGFSKMLKDELYGTLNQKQHQYVQGILNSAEHLLSLVNDFLDLSKLNAHGEKLFYEWVAVEDLCLSVISIVKPNANERGLELKLVLGFRVDFCYLDRKRWKQILINLLSNAIKFTPTGTIVLRVSRQGENLVFSVIDSGIGIAKEDQGLLFQPFQQLPNAINFNERGTGLGLALSRRLARLHGGDITLVSVPGKGSCFSAVLPLRHPSQV